MLVRRGGHPREDRTTGAGVGSRPWMWSRVQPRVNGLYCLEKRAKRKKKSVLDGFKRYGA